MNSAVETFETREEAEALASFKSNNPDLFQKDDRKLITHLVILISLLFFTSLSAVTSPFIPFKLFYAVISGFFWFSLINITMHHHLTHRNAAESEALKKVMDFLYMVAVPNAPKRRTRYTRAHMNHHLRPFHETDVDHHYGTRRYLKMRESVAGKILYFLELTFVGAHVPGWEDDRYMNQIPLESWNQKDYEAVKDKESAEAARTALLQWGGILAALLAVKIFGGKIGAILEIVVWGWALPMLLVKNWAHYLGQFQHYDPDFLESNRSIWKKTKTYHVPGWLNYLCGGELSGHFLHHLYPELPYYNVEAARKKMAADPALSHLFLIY